MLASAQSPSHAAPSTTGIATSANRMRCARFDRPRRSLALTLASVTIADCWSDCDFSKASLAALILQDRREEITAREVRPQDGYDVQLGVRELPEHEVRDALLSGRANQEIGIGTSIGVQVRTECILIDVRRVETTLSGRLGEPSCRANELRPRAIRDEELHGEAIIMRRRFHDAVDCLTSRPRQAVEIAVYTHANTVRDELRLLALDILLEQRHERGDLSGG